MPRIEKLVPVDGKFGVVLDVPLDQFNGGPVSIYTQPELDALIESIRNQERDAIADRLVKSIAAVGKCPNCVSYRCAYDLNDAIRARGTP